jgi:hypothetical protein
MSAPSARVAIAPDAGARPLYRKKRVLLPVLAVVVITAVVVNSNSSHTQPAAAQAADTSAPVTPIGATASATLPTESPQTTAPRHTTAPAGPAAPLTAQQYALLYKDPDTYKGQQYVLYGEVTQFDSATGPAAFLANVGPARDPITDGATSYVDNSELVGDAALLKNVVEGDVFSATIEVLGSDTYDTQTGGQTTVPKYRVLSISVYGSTR